MTGLREFHNRLRVMMSIDRHELIEAGIEIMRDDSVWWTFQVNPYRWLVACDDVNAERVWSIIERRTTRPATPPPPVPTTMLKGGMPAPTGAA
jgi:hypothetical protein